MTADEPCDAQTAMGPSPEQSSSGGSTASEAPVHPPTLLGSSSPVASLHRQGRKAQAPLAVPQKAEAPPPKNSPERLATLRDPFPGCESVNFDLYESQQYVEYVMRQEKWMGRLKGGFRWLYLCLAGVGAGLVASAIQFTVHHANSLQMETQHWLEEHNHPLVLRYLVWTAMCVAFASVAGALVCYVEPLAGGSGIPEIKCCLNGVDIPNVLCVRTLVCKAVGIVFSVASGLPCGKEGPMIHSGAIVGSLLSRVNAGPVVGPYRQNRESRDLTAAGAAAGVAAAFGAPIGGVLFAVEEGASHMNPRILVRCFVSASLATLTVRFFIGPMHDTSLFGTLGTDVPVEFGRFDRRSYSIWELGIFAGLGVAGGLCGALFNSVNLKLSRWRSGCIGGRGHLRFLEVLVVTATIATLRFFAPMVAGGADIEGYSSAQLLFVESGNRGICNLFHTEAPYSLFMLLLFAALHLAATCWTYGVGVPSGLFVPSLLGGAAVGRLLGQVLGDWQLLQTPPGVYALIGAAAFLGGMARITISLAVILMETTGEAEWGLPIFVAVVTAKWTGDLFNKGIYDIHINLKKVPLLEGQPEKSMLLLQASDVMARDVVTLPSRVSVGDLLSVLERCKHSGFPVIEPLTDHFVGLVERGVLHHLLASGKHHGIFSTQQREQVQPSGKAALLPQEEMLRRSCPSLAEVKTRLMSEHFDLEIDLLPYVNGGCFTVVESSSLARCYMLFRGMGLRHLPVLGADGTVRGIITRKDLIFEEAGREAP